jgi:hypothetical protein
MIDKGITYEDQRLTKKQKKKIKPVKQAGVMNYMPSKMVTVPKIAKSSPDTPTAKLAYITPEEEKILIDLNLYGSLDGKPNRGPGGIPSLEGDFGSPTGQASTGAGTGGTYSGGSGDEKVGGGGNNDGPTARDLAMGAGGKQKTGTITDVAELSKATGTDFSGGATTSPALEAARKANAKALDDLSKVTYKDVQTKIPAYIPYSGLINTGLEFLGGFGFEKNKDFFAKNVAGKYGYGYGYEDFEKYMEDRLSGKVGAYGNEAQGQNALRQPDDRQDTSGILEALLLPELTPTIGPVPEIGFNYIKPYSNQVVVAPGSQGLASLTGGQGFLSSII